MDTEEPVTLDQLADLYDAPLMRMDGFDDCCVGVTTGCGRQPALCYDREMVIKKLMADGMSEEDAEEFHEFNQSGAYVGEHTPVFLSRATVIPK